MLRKLMAATTLAILFASVAFGAEKSRTQKPVGTWGRKVEDKEVKFVIKPAALHCTVMVNDAAIAIDADYGVTKDGTLFGIVTKVEKKGTDNGPSEGHLFSFHYSADKDKLTISDINPAPQDEVKELLEGDYKHE